MPGIKATTDTSGSSGALEVGEAVEASSSAEATATPAFRDVLARARTDGARRSEADPEIGEVVPATASATLSKTEKPSRISTRTFVTPYGDRTRLGPELTFIGGPRSTIDWDRNITSGPFRKPVLEMRDLQDDEYRPEPSAVIFPAASQASLEKRVDLVIRQLFDPMTSDDALSPFRQVLTTTANSAYRSLSNAVGSRPSDQDKRDAAEGERVVAAMDNGDDYEKYVGALFRDSGQTKRTPIWGELRQLKALSSGPVPYATPLVAATIAHSVFGGDAGKAARALRVLRERGVTIEDLRLLASGTTVSAARATGSASVAASDLEGAVKLAVALRAVKGEGVAVLEAYRRGRTSSTGSGDEVARQTYLTVALKTQNVLTKRVKPRPVETQDGIEMTELTPNGGAAMADTAPPLRLIGSVAATHQEQVDFARKVNAAALKVSMGSDGPDDRLHVYAWHCGDRSEKEMNQTKGLVETMFVDWLLGVEKGKIAGGLAKAAEWAPYVKSVVTTAQAGLGFMIDEVAAARAADNPFRAFRHYGGRNVHIDWPGSEQKKYNVALQDGAESLLVCLDAALAEDVRLPADQALTIRFARARLEDVLARGRKDKPVEDFKGKSVVRSGEIHADESTRAAADRDAEDAKLRLDLVPFEAQDRRRVEAKVLGSADDPSSREGSTEAERQKRDMVLADLSAQPLPTLIEKVVRLLRALTEGDDPKLTVTRRLSKRMDAIESTLRTAAAIRQSKPIGVEGAGASDIIDAMHRTTDATCLGNRTVMEEIASAGPNRFTLSTVDAPVPVSAGPTVTANLAVSGRMALGSSGVATELALFAVVSAEIGGGGAMSFNALGNTKAKDYASFSLGVRLNGAMKFEKVVGVGVRGMRNVDENGLAFKVYTDGNGAGRPPGSVYDPSHGAVADADLMDEPKYNIGLFFEELKAYTAEKASGQSGNGTSAPSLYQHLADKFLDNGRVLVVGERHSASSQDVTLVGSLSAGYRTPGETKAGLGLTGTLGAFGRSSSVNRTDRQSQSTRVIGQHQGERAVTASYGAFLSPPSAPLGHTTTEAGEHGPSVPSESPPSAFLGMNYIALNAGEGFSPRSNLKDDQIDPFNDTLDFVFRNTKQGLEAIEADRAGWNSTLDESNLNQYIDEIVADSGPDKIFALRYHLKPDAAQRLNVLFALRGHLAEFTQPDDVASSRAKIESLVRMGIKIKSSAKNYVHQGIFHLKESFDRSDTGPNYGPAATNGRSMISEQERAFFGFGNGAAVELGYRRLGVSPPGSRADGDGTRADPTGMLATGSTSAEPAEIGEGGLV